MNVRYRGWLLVVALSLLALSAPAASALVMIDSVTTTPLAVGSRVNGHTMGSTGFTGSVFGVNVTVQCTTSAMTGTIKTNNTVGGVSAQLDSLAFTGCVGVNGTACTVTVSGLPWDPHSGDAAYDEGGFIATSTSAIEMGTGSSTSANNITISGCLPLGATCSYVGANSATLSINSPVTDSIVNRVPATWTNSTTANQLTLVNAQATSSCGNGQWNTGYTIRTGTTAGSGDLVALQ